jgi:hypothetical protein
MPYLLSKKKTKRLGEKNTGAQKEHKINDVPFCVESDGLAKRKNMWKILVDASSAKSVW